MIDIFEGKKYDSKITSWHMGSIFNSDNFYRSFITFFFFLNIFLSTDQFFNDDCLDFWGFQVKWSTLN